MNPTFGRAALAGFGSALALAAQAFIPAGPATAQPTPTTPPPTQTAPANQLASVVMAKGIKQSNLFGRGELTPIDPGTSFVNTDLPYAVIKAKALEGGTDVTIRVNDPSGPVFAIAVKAPKRDKPWPAFDFALPLYLLGTDLESHTGRWSLEVLFNGQPQGPGTAFDWETSSTGRIKPIRDQLAAAPTNADLHWRYGAALALLGARAEAVPELENAIKLDPRYALYYISLGRVYEQMGRAADAIKMFKAAIAQHGSYYDGVYARWAQAHLSRLEGR